MPIVNGSIVNYTLGNCLTANATTAGNTSMSGLGCLFTPITLNFPWFWAFMLVIWYITLFFIWYGDMSRGKFLAMTVSGFLLASILRGYNMVEVGTWASALGIMVLAFLIYLLIGEE